MSALSHQSFANTTTPYWASASTPTALVSPLSVVDTYGVPTKKVEITANGNGTGGIFYAGSGGGNPLGMAFVQGATQPQNEIAFDVGNVNEVLTLTTSNATFTQPIVLDSAVNAESLVISQNPSGTTFQTGLGPSMTLSNTAGPVKFGDSIFLYPVSGGNILVQNPTTTSNAQMDWNSVTFVGGGGVLGTLGVSGTSMYINTGLAAAGTGGVVVNANNGAQLTFKDATANIYTMQTNGAGTLQISAPSAANALTISSTGQVTIPDIVSGSFVPIGGIVMFSGNPLTLPANWKVCDGVYPGTPDLTNKFIIGVSPTYPLGTSGGSTSIATSNLPAHNHGVNDPGHSHDVVLSGLFNNGDNGTAIVYVGQVLGGPAGSRQSDPNAAQTRVTGITTQNTGSGAAYLPPYYALAYIMRVA